MMDRVCEMSNLASQPRWPMDDAGTDEVGSLVLRLRKFLEELPVLLRSQCHAVRSQQMDINAAINLSTEMNLREHTMRGTAGGVGPQMTKLWLFQFNYRMAVYIQLPSLR